MRMIQRMVPAMALAAATLFASASTQAASRLNAMETYAAQLYEHMVEMEPTLVRVYPRARNYGRILRLSGQVKAKALELRLAALHGRACDWQREIDALEDLMSRLEHNVEAASYRAEIGVDPPLAGCDLSVAEYLAQASAWIVHMSHAVPRVCGYPSYGGGIYKAPVINKGPVWNSPANQVPYLAPPKVKQHDNDLAPGFEPNSFYRRYDDRSRGISLDRGGATIRLGNLAFRISR